MDFCLLPTEILEKILSFLDIQDILNIRKINDRLSEISGSRGVIDKVKLFGCYELDMNLLTNFLTKWPTCNNITTFNVTSVYWIGASDLRKCILTMDNLQRLYVIDTKMGLTKSDVQLYCNLPKLRRLGVTITPRNFTKGAYKNLPPLTHVYIHVHTTMLRQLHGILPVIGSHDILEGLWIVEIGIGSIFQPISIKVPVNVLRVTTSSVSFSCHRDTLKVANLAKVYMSSVSDQQFSFRKLPQMIPSLCDREIADPHWYYLIKPLRACPPFPPKQFEEIFFDERKLDTMVFDEINFVHTDVNCTDNVFNHYSSLLLYPNMQKLEKLALNYCACLHNKKYLESQSSEKDQPATAAPKSACLLAKIADNSPNIEALELWTCIRVQNNINITNATLETIARFKNLKSLTLDNVPLLVSGEFLIKVLLECKKLKSLHIRSKEQNTRLHNLLIKALYDAPNLKDLRYEHGGHISIDNFFEGLAKKDAIKLDRLCLICDRVEVFSVQPFERFLQMNPQLVFLYIQVNKLPQTAVKKISAVLKKYKTDPRKIYIITHDGEVYYPDVHFYQMVRSVSRASTINVFTDFDN